MQSNRRDGNDWVYYAVVDAYFNSILKTRTGNWRIVSTYKNINPLLHTFVTSFNI